MNNKIAALTRKLAQAKAYANDVNDQLLKLQSVPDDEMEEEEQEEATGNPTPGGGGFRTWTTCRRLLRKLRASHVL